jgi:hypothetical protein
MGIVHDRYGEHIAGAPRDGNGIGHGWPLLVGEQRHASPPALRPTNSGGGDNRRHARSFGDDFADTKGNDEIRRPR